MGLDLVADEAPPTFQGLLEQLHARMGECLARRARAEQLPDADLFMPVRSIGSSYHSMASIERQTAAAQLRRYASALISLVDAAEHAGSSK